MLAQRNLDVVVAQSKLAELVGFLDELDDFPDVLVGECLVGHSIFSWSGFGYFRIPRCSIEIAVRNMHATDLGTLREMLEQGDDGMLVLILIRGRPFRAACRRPENPRTCIAAVAHRPTPTDISCEARRPRARVRPASMRSASNHSRRCDRARRGDRRQELPVVSQRIFLDLIRHDAISLAVNHVEYRLGPDQLRKGRDHDRVAQLLAHPGHFLEQLIEPVGKTSLGQLRFEIAQHAARHLVLVMKRVILQHLAYRLSSASAIRLKCSPT